MSADQQVPDVDMSTTGSIETHNTKVDTGLSSSTHSSSISAERYHLDELDERPVLVYQYRGGLGTSSQKDICAWLDCDTKLRVTKKTIPRYTSYIEVQRHDLYLPDEKEMYSKYPNYNSSLASVKIPSSAYWMRMFGMGGYDDLYIVSPESSPSSSIVGDDDSRRVSPTATQWGHDSELDAKLGAVRDQREKEEREGNMNGII